MKKIFSVLLALVLLLSLCACGKNDPVTTDPTGTSAATGNAETTGATNVTEPTKTPVIETDPLPEDPGICSHMWGNATCTTGRICSMCGQEEIGSDPLGHSWKDATCTTPKTCSRCGATEGNALEHTWSDATCTAPKTCSACGATEGNTADHNYVDDVCSLCNTNAPIKDFLGGWWTAYIERSGEYGKDIPDAGEILSVYGLKTDVGEEMYSHKDYYSNIHYGHPNGGTLPNNGTITYNEKTYYDFWFSSNMGGFDEIKAEANGDVRVDFMNDDNIVLQRKSATEFVVVSSENPESIPVGTVFTKDKT